MNSAFGHVPLEELIQKKAFELWDQYGRPENCGDKFWFLAEKEIKEQKFSPPPFDSLEKETQNIEIS